MTMCLSEVAYHYQPIAFLTILRDSRFDPELFRGKLSSDPYCDLYQYFLRHSNVSDYHQLEQLFARFQIQNEPEPNPEKACLVCQQFEKKILLECHHLMCVGCALSHPRCAECRAEIHERTLMH